MGRCISYIYEKMVRAERAASTKREIEGVNFPSVFVKSNEEGMIS